MSSVYTFSRNQLLIIAGVWVAITVAIALMVAYIPSSDSQPEVAPPATSPAPPALTDLPSTLPPQGDGPWMDPFLNKLVRPIHYDLYVDPDFYHDAASFKGLENITINVGESIQHLIVHYKYQNITVSRVWNSDNEELAIGEPFAYDPHQYWVVPLVDPLPAGTNVTLHLEFEGRLDIGIVGYYKSTYLNALTNQTSWLATTKFQPTDSRKAFPNFDEPEFKATFTVTQRHWSNFTAISNMPNESVTDVGGGWAETRHDKSVVMSSYLVCFIVFDFVYKDNLVGRNKTIPHRIWAPADRLYQVDYALELSVPLIDYYENEFNMGFHLPKMDQVAVPDYPSGATEHWGIITYRESRLLYDPSTASASDKQAVAEIVAHELAHNWFGNAITCLWWNDIWLNEGFASWYDGAESLQDIEEDFESYHGNFVSIRWWSDLFMNEAFARLDQFRALEGIRASWNMADHFVTAVMQPMMVSDAESSSRAITENVTHPDEINQAFSGPVYSKGASILRMLDNFLFEVGEHTFRDAIRNLLIKYEYGSVTTDDLWEEVQAVAGGNYGIAAMMDPWVEQMGFPVINVTEEAGSLVLKQSRFLNDPEADPTQPPAKFDYKWYVPLSYITKANTNPQFVWLNMTNATLADPRQDESDWIKFNYKQFGYFRVNYAPDMWNALSDELLMNHTVLNVVDRSNIMDDAFNLARASQLAYPLALNLTRYLSAERDYFPWSSVGAGLSYVSSMLHMDSAFTQWREYMVDISSPMMDLLGVRDGGEDEPHLDKLNREYIIMPLSCGHGYEPCLVNATELFLQWIENESFPLSPNLRRMVYRYGMQRTGGDDVWAEVWLRYERATGSERDNLAYCLAQTNRHWLIKRYIEYANDTSKVRTQDYFTVMNYMGYNPYANTYVWDWVRANYDYLVERFGTSDRYFGRMVPDMVSGYNTEFHLQEVLDFYAEYPDAGAGAGPREVSIASIQANIAWMNANRDDILDWLTQNL